MRMRRVTPVAYAPEWGTPIVYNIILSNRLPKVKGEAPFPVGTRVEEVMGRGPCGRPRPHPRLISVNLQDSSAPPGRPQGSTHPPHTTRVPTHEKPAPYHENIV